MAPTKYIPLVPLKPALEMSLYHVFSIQCLILFHYSEAIAHGYSLCISKNTLGFPSGTVVKNLSAKARVKGDAIWEDPLEEEMATHSRILAWKIPWTEKLGGLWSLGSQRGEPKNSQELSTVSIFHVILKKYWELYLSVIIFFQIRCAIWHISFTGDH